MHSPLVRSDGWEAVLDHRWRFWLAPQPTAVPPGMTDPDYDDSGWAGVDVPGLWTMQGGSDKPQYTNVQMPFSESAPHVPADNPTGCYRVTFRLPDGWSRAPDDPVDRRRRECLGRRRQRPARRDLEGLAPRRRVRSHRRGRPRRRQRSGARGRQMVRRQPPRGSGPLVARRHLAPRAAAIGPTHPHRRRQSDRRSPRRRRPACSTSGSRSLRPPTAPFRRGGRSRPPSKPSTASPCRLRPRSAAQFPPLAGSGSRATWCAPLPLSRASTRGQPNRPIGIESE